MEAGQAAKHLFHQGLQGDLRKARLDVLPGDVLLPVHPLVLVETDRTGHSEAALRGRPETRHMPMALRGRSSPLHLADDGPVAKAVPDGAPLTGKVAHEIPSDPI